MNSLRRAIRLCAVFNGNPLQVRHAFTCADDGPGSAIAIKKKQTAFTTVAENKIHRLRLIGGADCLLYHPDSLSTIRRRSMKYRHFDINVARMIDYDNKGTRNKLTIELIECPELLLKTLRQAFAWAKRDDKINIFQLSYRYYDDPIQGRKDCLLVSNEVAVRLSASRPRSQNYTYFSAAHVPMKPEDDYLFLFKDKRMNVDKEFAEILHVKVEERKNGCVAISDGPFDDTVGVIYTISTVNIWQLQLKLHGFNICF